MPFLWAKVLIFQGSAHQNGVGSLSLIIEDFAQEQNRLIKFFCI